jgi:dTDP-4-dehydrorhamnose reductase
MKVLVLGATGMLGHKLCQVLRERFETWATVRREPATWFTTSILDGKQIVHGVDATAFDSVASAVVAVRPDVVVNAIGIVKQQPAANDPTVSLAINSHFPHRLSALCQASGVRLIHFSTDCVFSGRRGRYTEDDPPDPEDQYGRSKLRGELNDSSCLTLRTSMIGRELDTTLGLLEWFLSNREKRVKGYTQAIYSGFSTLTLAHIIADLIAHHPHLSGIYHVSSAPISKYDLLCLLRQAYQVPIEIEPSAEVRCDRSLISVRFQAATGFAAPSWTRLVEELAADSTPYDEWRHDRAA